MAEPLIDPVAALEGGDPQAAERICRNELQQKPDDANLLVLLALSLWQQGNFSESLELYARLTRLYPDDSVHWRNYAAALSRVGDLEAAERAYETVVLLAPNDAELLELYGLVQMDLGKHVEARDTLLRAFGKSPDSAAIRIHAAKACAACRDSRSESLLQPWRQWLPLDDYLQSQLAEVLAQQGEAGSAVELVEDLLRRHPDERRLALRLAGLYERINRLDEARALLEEVAPAGDGIDAKTEMEGVREIAAQRAQLAMRRGQYADARAMLERIGPRAEGDYTYWFSLGQACDKVGDTAAAMHAFRSGHAHQIEELKSVVPHFFEADAEILSGADARVSADDYAGWPKLSAPAATQSPVFVVGFPRSGTTLLEQMLDAHPRLQSMDERPFFNMLTVQLENSTGFKIPRDLGRLDQRDCDELRKGYLLFACGKVPRRWNARLVDKNPLNMLWLPMIHRMFPEAKFILAIRHPCDVILSCYMQNFRAPVLAVAGQSLERLARAYVKAMENWLHHVKVFAPDVFISRYEDLVADTPGQTGRIAAFLGLEDAQLMLEFDARAREKGYIKTPSYSQVIEPINTKGIGRWHRYREHFETALPVLEPMLKHWGYAT
ncbi:MAG: tetratricopeptide repeat-containing sulfotransferase family protein [Rhodanobacteraceae bacterium]